MIQLQQLWQGLHSCTGQNLSTCKILHVATISSQHGWDDAWPKTVHLYCKPFMSEVTAHQQTAIAAKGTERATRGLFASWKCRNGPCLLCIRA